MDPTLEQNQRRLAEAIELYARQRLASHATKAPIAILLAGSMQDSVETWLFQRMQEWGERLRFVRVSGLDNLCRSDVFDMVAVLDGATPRMVASLKRLLKRDGLLLLETVAEQTWEWKAGLTRSGFHGVMARSERVAGSVRPTRDLILARSDGCVEMEVAKVRTEPPKVVASPVAFPADREGIRRRVISTLERILQLSEGDLDTLAPFTEFGVDSIVGVAFINELNRQLGSDLKPTVLFDHANVEKLATYIAQQAPSSSPVEARVAPSVEAPSSGVTPSPAYANDVAIIGMSGRFPGASDVGEFWRNLAEGKSGITEVPRERWDHSRFYDPDSRRTDKTNSKWGGFLADADKFDPLFFNISGREAEATDPQHRVFLEECYHAIEDAGYAGPSAGIAKKCGVYVGVEPGDYLQLVTAQSGSQENAPVFQGNAESILAARISYFLDLKGPSLAINTACSSSLVAIHLACRSLVNGDCDMALAGGVRVFATEKAYLALGNMGMLSPDGQCKTFDEGANGFVPGEAVGVLVLKPLAAALRDGDHVHGVIKGSAINQDGRTNGITAPSSISQTLVELEAYENAGVQPETIQYVEAHGTGTKLGDPIEVQALTQSFRKFTAAKQICAIGAVKTNIGHTMAAAGVCSVIKVLLSLRNKQVPPSLNLRKHNPYVDFETSPFFVNTTLRDWTVGDGQPRRAAVSSFGFSGTNSHAVIEEAPPRRPADRHDSKPAYLVTLSAKSREALQELLQRFAVAELDSPLQDLSFTLNVGRGHFDARCAVVAGSLAEFRDTIASLARGEKVANGWRCDRQDAETGDDVIHRQLVEMILKELPGVRDATVHREKLAALAALYVKGHDLDWRLLHQGESHRRIPLPTYPFARERYWVGEAAKEVPRLHPLVHRDVSTPSQTRFVSMFDGREFFLDGHQVGGRKTLPGVAYLEMAVAAAKLSGDDGAIRLSNLAWLRPLTVERETEVGIRVTRDESGSRFEVVSGDGAIVHAEGRVSHQRGADQRREELAAIKSRCARVETPEAVYSRCEKAGLKLGEGFRTLREIWVSDNEALSRIERPASSAGEFTLHPALLDGALQTTAVLGGDAVGGLPVPFAVAEVSVRPLPSRCYAHVQREPEVKGLRRFHVTLMDETGLVLVELKGLAMRGLRAGTVAAGDEVLCIRPTWAEKALSAAAGRGLMGKMLLFDESQSPDFRPISPRLEIVSGGAAGALTAAEIEQMVQAHDPDHVVFRWDARSGNAAETMRRGILPVFHLTRALVRRGGSKPVSILCVHPSGAHPALAAVAGYARTLRMERPNLFLRVVEASTFDAAQVVAELAVADRAHEVRMRGGRREVKGLEIFTPKTGVGAGIREGGVYWITGGAGGLGMIFARHLAKHHRARPVLMGRSELSPEQRVEVENLGGIYLRGDVTRSEDVSFVLREIKSRFGALHGVIHAAGVIRDGFVRTKGTEDFMAVVAPKVLGAEALDVATRAEPLDFFVLFSSMAGVLGNAGQGDYAYANHFLDEFAHWREPRRARGERAGRTISLDWPMWREGGMRQSADLERMKLKEVGLSSLESEAGLALFETALGSDEPQVMALVGQPERVRLLISPPAAAVVEPIAEEAAGHLRGPLLRYLTDQFAKLVKLPASRIEARAPLEKYGIDSIMVMEFTQRLEKDFGELSKTLLFEHQTIAELAEHFVQSHAGRVAGLFPAVAPQEIRAARTAPVIVEAPATTMPATEDIAIIGVFGRYPMAEDLDEFWENLRSGKDCIIEIPRERWDWRLFFDARPGQVGKTPNKWGGFLRDVEKFDAQFFSIMPREAFALDPQERLFLETVWRAVEDAGYRKSALANRKIGVFVGVMYGEYQLYGAGNIEQGRVFPLSSSYASIANRVSYFFNWHGPSMAVDTMCSSSLTSIHLACMSLLRGESELAVAGGVNTTLHPHKDMLLSPGGFAASDGRCRSFGEGGDGYVPGEGVGAVLLKPLARAIADGDHIHAVIKATAVNHGGKTNGYTVPNPKAQADLICQALMESKLDPRTINYIEAHGTGTVLGDPIEITSLTKAFRQAAGGTDLEKHGCAVGSVKSNIGHLESAAGIAGVTKVLLQMRHAQIVPSLHSSKLNPNIKFDHSPFEVPQSLRDWTPSGGSTRRAGVSSFGAGGANAHVILEEFVEPERAASTEGPFLFVLSARNEDRLRARARQLLDFLSRRAGASEAPLGDVAYTLQVGREAFEERLAFVASDRADAVRKLDQFLEGMAGAETVRGSVRSGNVEVPSWLEGEEGRAFLDVVLRQRKWDKLAQIWASGASVEWDSLHRGSGVRRVPLPTYPFAGERYWAPDKLRDAAVAPLAITTDHERAGPLLLQPVWREKDLSSQREESLRGNLLLFDSEETLRVEIEKAYPALSVTRIIAGERFVQESGTIRINPGSDEDYRRLVDTVSPDFVVHRWANLERDPVCFLEAGMGSLFRLTRALIQRGVGSRVRLLFTHPLEETPMFAAVSAFAKTLAQEQPKLQLLTIQTDECDVGLLSEWFVAGEDREIRRRKDRREVRRLEPLEAIASAVSPFRKNGVYLISGGLGGLGRVIAAHLASRHQARLVLTGRSALTDETRATIRSLESLGGEVLHVRGDISRADDARAAVDQTRVRFGAIHGVIHAAGAIRDAFILKKEISEFMEVIAAKVRGATALDEATRSDPLDFFAMFSSTAGAFGNVGQADYAFANAFLDSYARVREARRAAGGCHGRTLSINWPFWNAGGMRMDSKEMMSRLERVGIQPLPSEDGIALFERLLGGSEPQVVALWGNRDRLTKTFLGETSQPPEPELMAEVDDAKLLPRIETHLKETLAGVTQLPVGQIDSEQRFEEFGVDSIVVNDFNLRLETDLGTLPKTLLFEQPNIRQLAKHLIEEYRPQVARFLGAPVSSPATQPVVVESAALAVQARPAASSEDIAIIGLAGRYPGAENLRAFWRVLESGKDCVTEIPRERWDINRFYDPDPEKAAQGKMYCRWGAFLDGVDRFDPLFFNIAPVEAELMDPQERLFLETAWTALEDAGYTRKDLRRWVRKDYSANVGVFVGVTTNTYALVSHDVGAGNVKPTSLPWSFANRISYLFNFNGPSMPVDTACSSSLTAIHLACEAIRRGECQQAIAGGVNLYLHPSKYAHLCMMKMLSSDGKCRAFGEGGDGFVPGEGVGAILLKPLSLAVADADHIHGVIKATAVNHGGRTGGYTVPNPVAQAEVIVQALKGGRIDPRSISYLEAHGTGTALGDPIEVAGLAKAFAESSDVLVPVQSCSLGTVKSNIGHLEAAAGIAGLTKVLLQMKHRQLAPSLHADPLNPKIVFEGTPFRVQRKLETWEPPTVDGRGVPRRAGISSFGAGGANAHIVVEEFVAAPVEDHAGPSLIVLSARNRERLKALAADLQAFVTDAHEPAISMKSLAFTLQVGREALEERVAFVVTDRASLNAGLKRVMDDVDDGVGLFRGRVKRERVQIAAEGDASEMLESDDLKEVARAWVSGGAVDWPRLHAGLRVARMSLPGYPFARDRYWVPAGGVRAGEQLHSLVHRNESTLDGLSFSTRLGVGDLIVRDHEVGGRKILPGAAILEMAMAGLRLAMRRSALCLRNVVWSRPAVVEDGGITLKLRVRSGKPGVVNFELQNERGETLAQGIGHPDDGVSNGKLDRDGIEARCSRSVEPAKLYEGFASRGLAYGEGFRVIRKLRHADDEVWSELEVPSVWTDESFHLHPALADGAFQSLSVIGAGRDGLEIPFEIGEVICRGPLPARCFAHGRAERDLAGVRRYNLDLANEKGEILARLRGLAMRRTAKGVEETFFCRPTWVEAPPVATGHGVAGTLLLLDDDPRLAAECARENLRVVRVAAGERYAAQGDIVTLRRDQAADFERLVREVKADAVIHRWSKSGAPLDEALERGIESLHRLVRALSDRGRAIPILYVHPTGQTVCEAVGAYARSLRQEAPKLRLTSLGIDVMPAAEALLAELSGDAIEARWQNGVREERSLEEYRPSEAQPILLKRGGVYLVTGGAGGLGRIFAEFLVKEYDARLVLVGRSELDDEVRRRLREIGGQVMYVTADVGEPTGASEAVRRTKELYGRIDGVLHAAGVLRDGWIRNKSDEDFRAVLRPKVRGVNALDEATRDEALDWFVTFSSTAALLGNAGQADYAFANAYLDAFAHERNERVRRGERHGVTCSINWPLWKDGGMRAGGDAVRFQADALGLLPLESGQGVRAFVRALESGESQCAVFHGSSRTFFQRIERKPAKNQAPPPPIRVRDSKEAREGLMEDLKRMVAKVLRLDVSALDPEADMSEYGFDSITFTSLANEVNRAFVLEVTPAVMFEHRTLQSFADFLWHEHAGKLAGRYAAVPEAVGQAAPLAHGSSSALVFEGGQAGPLALQFQQGSSGGASREPIAIIGMSGVFPGSRDLDVFWRNLDEGMDLISRAPSERWSFATEAPWGGFIADVDKFDSLFFDISPREAELMDPQQRLFLETVWKTIEDAGLQKSDLAGTKTGLFVGVAANDYANLLAMSGVPVEAYSSTGNAHSVLANRISFFFDLRGPSEAIDTACSSSLVAIHRAIESIESGSSDAAIVGGVNVLLSPAAFSAFGKAGMLGDDGRCKTFDERANGYVRGEGVGAILLKPLSRALRDGDPIHGVIRGSAENHGGHVQSLTVPNPNAQAQLLCDAFARAGVDPHTIGCIEAHGTGTSLGDPIEINGLKKAFGQNSGEVPMPKCAVGAVKTNIGHLETAAGIAGIIKVLLAMRHGRIPGNVHLRKLNPYIQVEGSPFFFPQHSISWEPLRDRQGRVLPRRAGVSSFGFGGANAHIVLEEYPSVTDPAPAVEPELILLSARDGARLREMAVNLVAFLDHESNEGFTGARRLKPGLREIAHTLRVGRQPMDERLSLIVSSREELVEKLGRFLRGEDDIPGCLHGNTAEKREALKLLRQVHDESEILPAMLKARDFGKLAPLWIAGVEVDWAGLQRGHDVRRVSLPTYTFARERHWVPVTTKIASEEIGVRLHPLVHRNDSTFKALKFSSRFGGSEVVVRDHVAGGRRVLPGAAILEMMMTSLCLAGETDRARLTEVTWLRPVTVEEGGADVTLTLHHEEDGLVRVELRNAAGDLLAQAKGGPAPAPRRETLDLAAIRRRCGRSLDVAGMYAEFARRGLQYGEGFRTVRELHHGEREVLCLLEIPTGWGGEKYRMHPALLDGALQSLAMIRPTDGGLEIPFAVRGVSCSEPLPARCYAYGCVGEGRGGGRTCDVKLLGESGEVLASLDGLAVRKVPGADAEILCYRPTWVEALPAATGARVSGNLLVLDDGVELPEDLRRKGMRVIHVRPGAGFMVKGDTITLRRNEAKDYRRLLKEVKVDAVIHAWSKTGVKHDEALERGILSVHHLTQALLKSGRKEVLPLVYVYPEGEPVYEAVGGYAKSLRQEQPKLRMKTVATMRTGAFLLDELADSSLEARWRGNTREVRRIEEKDAAVPAKIPPLKHGAVCVITGGAGGLGLIFAEHLVKACGARLVLAGRSELGAEKRRRIEALGSDVAYVRADVGMAADAARVVGEAKRRFGRVDAILHAAGELRDGLTWSKTDEDFQAVLHPKVRGTLALDEATRNEPLEWFVMFSSSVGLFGNAGQADYAFANAYLDAYARAREVRRAAGECRGRTLSINWPLWKDGGMRVAAGGERSDALGLVPLDVASGLRIFERAVQSGEAQLWGCIGSREKIRVRLLEPPSDPATPVRTAVVPVGDRGEILDFLRRHFSTLSKLPESQIRAGEPLEKYGLDSIMGVEFTRQIEKRFGELSKTLVFEHPTLDALADHLLEQHGVGAGEAATLRSEPVVKVAEAVPSPVIADATRRRRVMALAPMDYVFVGKRRLAIQVLYYFEKRLDFERLRSALDLVCEAFYPVNAQLVLRGEKEFLIRECGDRPDFREVICEAGVAVPEEGRPSTLLSFQVDFDPTRSGGKLAMFRLHQLKQGSLLSVNVSHSIADGYSFYYFMSAWASACRGEPFLPPDHSRNLLTRLARRYEAQRMRSRVRRFDDPEPQLPLLAAGVDPTTTRVDTLTFDGPAILAEARSAAKIGEEEKLTENSVLTALIWKLYAKSLPSTTEKLVLACPMNFRRLNGRWTPAFFGNASAPAILGCARERLLNETVATVAAMVTDAVRGCDERTLIRYNAAIDAMRRTKGLEATARAMLADPGHGLVVTNVARFPLPPMDFGTGPCAQDFNAVNYAGTGVIAAGAGPLLKVRLAYPELLRKQGWSTGKERGSTTEGTDGRG